VLGLRCARGGPRGAFSHRCHGTASWGAERRFWVEAVRRSSREAVYVGPSPTRAERGSAAGPRATSSTRRPGASEDESVEAHGVFVVPRPGTLGTKARVGGRRIGLGRRPAPTCSTSIEPPSTGRGCRAADPAVSSSGIRAEEVPRAVYLEHPGVCVGGGGGGPGEAAGTGGKSSRGRRFGRTSAWQW